MYRKLLLGCLGLVLTGCVTTDQQVENARAIRQQADAVCQKYRPGTEDHATCVQAERMRIASNQQTAASVATTTGAAIGGAILLPLIFSDKRLKTDIARVGEENGFPLYSFRYLWSAQRYIGVMADDVAAVRPDAVLRGPDGFLRVDYNALGISFRTWEDWMAAGRN